MGKIRKTAVVLLHLVLFYLAWVGFLTTCSGKEYLLNSPKKLIAACTLEESGWIDQVTFLFEAPPNYELPPSYANKALRKRCWLKESGRWIDRFALFLLSRLNESDVLTPSDDTPPELVDPFDGDEGSVQEGAFGALTPSDTPPELVDPFDGVLGAVQEGAFGALTPSDNTHPLLIDPAYGGEASVQEDGSDETAFSEDSVLGALGKEGTMDTAATPPPQKNKDLKETQPTTAATTPADDTTLDSSFHSTTTAHPKAGILTVGEPTETTNG